MDTIKDKTIKQYIHYGAKFQQVHIIVHILIHRHTQKKREKQRPISIKVYTFFCYESLLYIEYVIAFFFLNFTVIEVSAQLANAPDGSASFNNWAPSMTNSETPVHIYSSTGMPLDKFNPLYQRDWVQVVPILDHLL